MKTLVLSAFLLTPLLLFSQFTDNFSDGQFSAPRQVEWTGETAKFIVNASLQLQLNDTDAATTQLSTASTLSTNACWEWWMKLDFTPSQSNYAKVYLFSDSADLGGLLNGVFVRVGYSNKNICLIQQKTTSSSNKTLIAGTENRLTAASNSLNLKATLDKQGNFNLYSKLEGEEDFTLEGSCNFTENIDSQSFGIVCVYTKTRAQHFYFDDFTVRTLGDDEQGEEPIPDKLPEYGDIVFSEIMAKPGTDYPEYIELYNASADTFSLKNCLFWNGANSYALPDSIVFPHEYFVLAKPTAAAQFQSPTKFVGVTSFPAVTDAGKLLMLTTTDNTLVSWFEYTDKMYGDDDKKAGGYSLECIDLTNVGNTAANWTGSTVEHGTPGEANSAAANNPDAELPVITSIATAEGNAIAITFSKPMNRESLHNFSVFTINDADYSVLSAESNYPQGNALTVVLSAMPPQGTLLELQLTGAVDLTGLAPLDYTVVIGSGLEASEADVVINEIMYNPPAGGDEWIEIYNRSDKALDLQFLGIATRKTDGTLNKAYQLASMPELLYPEEFLVITHRADSVCSVSNCHDDSRFAELAVFPALNNSGATIVVLNTATLEPIDEVTYSDSWHSQGISSTKGISLERTAFTKPSNDPANWHSASEDCGFATPGYQNSAYTGDDDNPTSNDEISIDYPQFETDNYVIRYRMATPGFRCNAKLFDSAGRMMFVIANNQLLGAQGELLWNGRGQSNSSLSSGIYIIYLELYDMSGVVKQFKKAVVLK